MIDSLKSKESLNYNQVLHLKIVGLGLLSQQFVRIEQTISKVQVLEVLDSEI